MFARVQKTIRLILDAVAFEGALNRAVLRAWIAQLAAKTAIDLDAEENRFSVWYFDGTRPWFVAGCADRSEAIKVGSVFGNRSNVYVLHGKDGDLRSLEAFLDPPGS